MKHEIIRSLLPQKTDGTDASGKELPTFSSRLFGLPVEITIDGNGKIFVFQDLRLWSKKVPDKSRRAVGIVGKTDRVATGVIIPASKKELRTAVMGVVDKLFTTEHVDTSFVDGGFLYILKFGWLQTDMPELVKFYITCFREEGLYIYRFPVDIINGRSRPASEIRANLEGEQVALELADFLFSLYTNTTDEWIVLPASLTITNYSQAEESFKIETKYAANRC